MGNKNSAESNNSAIPIQVAPPTLSHVASSSVIQGLGSSIQLKTKAVGVDRFINENNDKVMPDTKPTIKDFSFVYTGEEILWCEWWTLYFYGGEDEVDGLLNYIFFKAPNGGTVYLYPALVLPGQKLQHIESDSYTLNEWKASATETDVTIGEGNRFYALDKEHNSFRIVGCSKDKEVSWDMRIDRDPAIPPLVIADALPLANNQNITFMSPVPCGPCYGSMEILGKKYEIDGLGEIEHIYGPLLLPTINWNLTHGYNKKETTSLYWLHVPFEKEGKDNSCGGLRFQHQETVHLWKAFEYTFLHSFSKQSPTYPNKTILTCQKNKSGFSCRITYKTTSISASNASDASENHVLIKVRLMNEDGISTIYRLDGMAEHHRFDMQKIVNKVKEAVGVQ